MRVIFAVLKTTFEEVKKKKPEKFSASKKVQCSKKT